MKRRTKIVCTLGPAVDSREKIAELIEAGMNVARLNCSHGDWETRRRWVRWIRELCRDVAPCAILADLQGPKFRIGDLPGGAAILAVGKPITLGPQADATIPVEQPEILAAMDEGSRLLLGDGEVELKLTGRAGVSFDGVVVTGGTVKSRQGITLVGKVFDVPSLTDKDREDLAEAARLGVDYIALSYVKHAGDIGELRREVDKYDPTIGLCAKIETREALKEIESILEVVDLVMVARGDLGLQMDIEDVPIAQKKIIQRCTWHGKPVITATQMLESMIHASRPTRAEATDIANAILDGTDALMLSGETAAGEYPVECVRTMVRIAEKAEMLYDRAKIEKQFADHAAVSCSHTEAVAHAVAELASLLNPRALVTTTTSGQTARLVSKFRPRAQILCATYDARTQARLAVVWGVEALQVPLPATTDESIGNAIDAFVAQKRLKQGDLVIVTAGVPAGVAGNTNMILTQVVK